ncbi:MAG: dehydrogenase, partial [Pedobacter sp.]
RVDLSAVLGRDALTIVRAGVRFEKSELILKGDFNKSLTESLPEPYLTAWKAIETISINKIYNSSSVIQKEVAGYKVMEGLLEEFIPAVIHNNTHYYKKLVKLIPSQFITENADTYTQILNVLDFVSGMTDLYAVELYSKIKGISFPSVT